MDVDHGHFRKNVWLDEPSVSDHDPQFGLVANDVGGLVHDGYPELYGRRFDGAGAGRRPASPSGVGPGDDYDDLVPSGHQRPERPRGHLGGTQESQFHVLGAASLRSPGPGLRRSSRIASLRWSSF